MFMAIRQRGHNPVGELGGSGVPHCGQTGVDPVLIPDTYRSLPVCYTTKRFSSRLGQNPGQITQLRVQLRPIGQRLGDLFPIQLAKPFP